VSQVSARPALGLRQIAIIALTLATAVIHLWLAIPETLIMFYLNGLGYIALVAALFLPQFQAYRRIIRWVLMGFTAVTIIGWIVMGERNAIAYIDKAIEVALLILLGLEARQAEQ
jgi:hypothetical protein